MVPSQNKQGPPTSRLPPAAALIPTPGCCLGFQSSLVRKERKLSRLGRVGQESRWVGREKLEATHSEGLNRAGCGQGRDPGAG